MTIPSPCINICIINQSSGICAGCARTLDEIAIWGTASDDVRRAIIARLPARRSVTKPLPPQSG